MEYATVGMLVHEGIPISSIFLLEVSHQNRHSYPQSLKHFPCHTRCV